MSLNLDKSTWNRVAFGDVVKNLNITVKDPVAEGIDRVIAMEHLDPGELKISRWGDLSDGTTFTRRVRPGQTLFGKRRAYQRKAAYAEFDAICSGDILVFEAGPQRLLPELLPFLVQSEGFYAHALGTSAGSLSPRTNWRDLANFEFDLPPLDEQKRIAELLWSVQSEIEAVRSLEVMADCAREALRDKLFDGQPANVAFETVTSLPSQNGMAAPKKERAGSTPMVNMGQMFLGEILREGDFEQVATTSDNFLLRDGDLLFARRSIVFEGAGICCMVPALGKPHTFESSIIRVTPDPKVVVPSFLLHFFRSSNGRDAMSKIVRRGPVSGIAGSDLRKLPVPLPNLAEQQRIVDVLSSFYESQSALLKRGNFICDLMRALSLNLFGDPA